MKSFLLSFVLVYLVSISSAADNCPDKPRVVCYFGSWAYYRPAAGSFNISNFDSNLCTHLIYTFAALDVNLRIYPYDYNVDVALGGYANAIKLKEKNPCLKTLLAIGGWNEGSLKYSVMASTASSRSQFAEDVLRFITFYGFDGFDIDWEYPTSRGGLPADKDNLAALIMELKNRFSPWNFELTMAVPAEDNVLKNGYDVETINQYIDAVHLMAYDYTSSNANETGLLAPLTAIKSSVDFWLSQGLDAKKLVLGVPSYARSFILSDKSKNSIGAPVTGPGEPGEYTQEAGFLSYYEFYNYIEYDLVKPIKSDSNCYGSYDGVWFTFDTIETYKEKCEWALNKNLGGIMIWSIDTDDFLPMYETQYPVLKVINDCIASKRIN